MFSTVTSNEQIIEVHQHQDTPQPRILDSTQEPGLQLDHGATALLHHSFHRCVHQHTDPPPHFSPILSSVPRHHPLPIIHMTGKPPMCLAEGSVAAKPAAGGLNGQVAMSALGPGPDCSPHLSSPTVRRHSASVASSGTSVCICILPMPCAPHPRTCRTLIATGSVGLGIHTSYWSPLVCVCYRWPHLATHLGRMGHEVDERSGYNLVRFGSYLQTTYNTQFPLCGLSVKEKNIATPPCCS